MIDDEATVRTEAAIVADVARREADSRAAGLAVAGGLPDHLAVRVVRQDERIEVTDLEKLAEEPRDRRGGAVLHSGPSFVTYVARQEGEATTIWADPTARSGHGKVVAIFNDHQVGVPGWRDHHATFEPQLDPDWAAWLAIDGQLLDQKRFAQHLLDRQHTIKSPAPARLMPAVLQFQAARSAQYESGVNLDNGEVRMVYVEDVKTPTRGKQNVALPQVITLQVFPYLGAVETDQAMEVEARVRWEIPSDGGSLKIGVKLTRPDKVTRDGWERECARIADGVNAPLLQGVAPTGLR